MLGVWFDVYPVPLYMYLQSLHDLVFCFTTRIFYFCSAQNFQTEFSLDIMGLGKYNRFHRIYRTERNILYYWRLNKCPDNLEMQD